MDHVAIDLGGRESQICVRSSDGKTLEERRVPTERLGAYLAQRGRSKVILETCAEAFAVADQARATGHVVCVVPATLVRTLGVGARKVKTDRRDAQVLSEVSCRIELPGVHIPSPAARESKSACGMREALVESRTKLINTVRGWMRARMLRAKTGKTSTFSERVKARATERSVSLPLYVEQQLETIEHLTGQIARADETIEQMAQSDPRCQRLMTVPGVGPVTSVRFVAALDELGRFPSAHHVESYLGLVPGQDSSSDSVRHTSITKAGSSAVRRVLVQACWSMRRCRPADPLVRWCLQVEQRRGKRVAIVAMARKLAGILFAMLRDQANFSPIKTSTLGAELAAASAQQQEDQMRAALATITTKRPARRR